MPTSNLFKNLIGNVPSFSFLFFLRGGAGREGQCYMERSEKDEIMSFLKISHRFSLQG